MSKLNIEQKSVKALFSEKKADFLIPDYGTMSELEQALSSHGFARCNNCYLVNLQHVREIRGMTVFLYGDIELKISQSRRKAFAEVVKAFSAGKKVILPKL